MKKALQQLFKDPIYVTGIVLILLSTAILFLTIKARPIDGMGIFLVNYLISIGYLLTIWIKNFSVYGWKLSKGKIEHTILLLILWLVSAFSLNLEMNVFESSVTWLSIWIIFSCTVLALASNFSLFSSKIFKQILFFCLGSALVLFMYYATYLFPLYIISLVGLLAVGISFHTYIPLFLFIATLTIIIRAVRVNKSLLWPVILGTCLPLFASGLFLWRWNQTNLKIASLINQNALNESKLPAWITVSEQLEPNFITERLLKAGLVYHEVSVDNFFWDGMPNNNSFDEQKQHDPLVIMATLFFKKSNLDDKDRVNILKSMYKSRHQAQERLWSGDHLSTLSIINNIKLFPAYRMAYTEKTLTIGNDAQRSWSNQEAIYTFHLHEGSVVSSLSLWINGKEEKSRLTTKSKADSAYNTIVGVEQHDPSVIHWQEGNNITVRVFPCTPEENRKFKIGITSPLLKKENQLVYQDISFDGPPATNALQSTQLAYEGKIDGLKLPSQFEEISAGVFRAEESFDPHWEASFSAPMLTNIAFSFANNSYQIANYKKKYFSFNPATIYLDLNATWSEKEFDQIWATIKTKLVFVFDGKISRLTEQNKDGLFKRLSAKNFSLFPIYEISNPEQALIISKGSESTPNLNDLEDSEFSESLSKYLSKPHQLQVYHLGLLQSPYLKALKELRVLNCEEGDAVIEIGRFQP